MQASVILRAARERSGLSLRQLARRADTSHATLSAYQAGAKVPSVATLDRIVRAAGLSLDVELTALVGGADREARGRELAEVLELAAAFPTRHDRSLSFPIFGRAP
jgi:transcriptional regulator with XRE-family HTH domain